MSAAAVEAELPAEVIDLIARLIVTSVLADAGIIVPANDNAYNPGGHRQDAVVASDPCPRPGRP